MKTPKPHVKTERKAKNLQNNDKRMNNWKQME